MMRFGEDMTKTIRVPPRTVGLVLAVMLAGSVAGCGGPPALTQRTIEGKLTNTLWDRELDSIQPIQVAESARGIERYLIRKQQNFDYILRPQIQSAGGTCLETNGRVYCRIYRNVVTENCFRGQCGRLQKIWTVSVTWNAKSGPISPQVHIQMTQKPIS